MLRIFYFFYYIVWTLILPCLYLLASLVIKKWKPGLKMRIGQIPEDVYLFKNPIWFHAVSVGEFNALLPLLKQFFGMKIVLSVTTNTAYELATKKLKDEIENNLIKVFYMPWDHPAIINVVVKRINPQAILLMESEIWPGLIIAAKNNKSKIAILNAKISDGSYNIYYFFGFIFEPIFKLFDLVLAQSSADSRKYLNLKVAPEKLFMLGNMKFSALPNLSYERRNKLRNILGYSGNELVWVCGSTHEEEEVLLISIFQELKEYFENLRLVIAPRHPQRFGVVETIINSAAKLIPIKLSEVKKYLQAKYLSKTDNFDDLLKAEEASKATEEVSSRRVFAMNDVLLVDTLGDLFDIYSIANFAFVGGTINEKIGGHNVLEPAVCNIPVISGPHYHKNRAMFTALEDAEGLIICETKEDIRINLQSLIEDDDKRILMGANGKSFTEKNRKVILEMTKMIGSYLDIRQKGME